MPKDRKSKDTLPKSNIVFQGKTIIMGDNVNQKIVNGNEIHGDNISITGNSNIIGDKNSIWSNKTISNDENLATAFSQIVHIVTQSKKASSEEILSALDNLQNELKKGDNADIGKLSPWLKMIKAKAPEIVGSLLEIFIHPLVGKTVELVARQILMN